MSYIICGTIEFSSVQDLTDIRVTKALRQFANVAALKSMHVETGSQCLPEYVLEMLRHGIKNGTSIHSVPFFLTGLQHRDNSEEILFPSDVRFSSKEYRNFLHHRIAEIKCILQQLVVSTSLEELIIIFSSSFEERYQEVVCSFDEFVPIVYEKLRTENWLASFQVRLTLLDDRSSPSSRNITRSG